MSSTAVRQKKDEGERGVGSWETAHMQVSLQAMCQLPGSTSIYPAMLYLSKHGLQSQGDVAGSAEHPPLADLEIVEQGCCSAQALQHEDPTSYHCLSWSTLIHNVDVWQQRDEATSSQSGGYSGGRSH